jgi:hypothetical protein
MVEFVSDRMSYVILRGRWWYVIVLNVHAPAEAKIDDVKENLREELENVFDKSPKYHVNILLLDFSAKVVREDILNPTVGNESLQIWTHDPLFERVRTVHALDQWSSAWATHTPGGTKETSYISQNVNTGSVWSLNQVWSSHSRLWSQVLACQKQAQSSHKQVRITLIIDQIFNDIILLC